jgi:hypothetical protein
MQLRTMGVRRDLQSNPAVRPIERKDVRIMESKQAVIMMKNGKMMMRSGKQGIIRPMEEDMAIFDGTRVMTNGTVVMADGVTRTMMEGEALTMDGRITDMAEVDTQKA